MTSVHRKSSKLLREIAMQKIAERKNIKQFGKTIESKTPDNLKVYNMINEYRKMLGSYYHKPEKHNKIHFNSITKKHRGYKQYLKASKLAEKRDINYETYLTAQFYWFDKWFNRAPRSYEISGGSGIFPAALRVEKYLDLFPNKDNPTIKSVAIPVKMSAESLDEVNNKTLRSLKQVWNMNEAEIYVNFAVGVESAFNFSWLKSRPVYQRLVEIGLA